MRVTVVSPGFTRSELTDHGGDPAIQGAARAAADQLGLPAYAVAQPSEVDVRPTAQR